MYQSYITLYAHISIHTFLYLMLYLHNLNASEFAQNQHRDLSALFCSHDSMLQTVALAENCSLARARYEQKQHMFRPIGIEDEQ